MVETNTHVLLLEMLNTTRAALVFTFSVHKHFDYTHALGAKPSCQCQSPWSF